MDIRIILLLLCGAFILVNSVINEVTDAFERAPKTKAVFGIISVAVFVTMMICIFSVVISVPEPKMRIIYETPSGQFINADTLKKIKQVGL